MDERGGRGADARLLVLLEPLAEVERGLGAIADRLQRPAVGARQAALALEHVEVLADRDRGHAEPGGQVPDPHAALLGHEAGDVVLAFAGEDIAGRGAGRDGQRQGLHAVPITGTEGFHAGIGASCPEAIRNVKKLD